MFYLLLYNLLIHLLSPALLALLYWPKRGKPGFGRRWPEHLGFVPPTRGERPVWLHAVSVGEIVAATPLIRKLKAEHPELPVLVTTTTRTGADQAAKLGDLVEHRYAPLDFPWAVTLFLRRIQPRALLIMETELWPNLLHACGRRRLPVLLLNARLSARSAARYRRFHGIFRLLAGNLTHLACQHQDDAERFKQLGIAETKISVTGSIKFDIHYDENLCSEGKQLRQKLGYQRPVWIAASTHEGEDEQVLKAHHLLLKHVPDALLILVPRHPQRFNNVAALAKSEGFILIRRSQSIVSPSHFSSCQVYLGDTMGELPLMFASADIAFVGGSLVDRGGHNLLEPAALSMPVLTGPSTFNFSYIVQQLINAGGAQIVIDYTQLSIKLNYLFSQHEIIKIMGKHAKEVVSKNTGSLNKSLEKISALLDIKKQ